MGIWNSIGCTLLGNHVRMSVDEAFGRWRNTDV
jgi:hypothetical protein